MLYTDFLLFKSVNGVQYLDLYLANNGTFTTLTPVQINDRFKVLLNTNNPNEIELYRNDNFLTAFTRNNSTNIIRVNTYQVGYEIVNVQSSFGCPVVPKQYAHLDYKLD